jgi:hypothetical protein
MQVVRERVFSLGIVLDRLLLKGLLPLKRFNRLECAFLDLLLVFQ